MAPRSAAFSRVALAKITQSASLFQPAQAASLGEHEWWGEPAPIELTFSDLVFPKLTSARSPCSQAHTVVGGARTRQDAL